MLKQLFTSVSVASGEYLPCRSSVKPPLATSNSVNCYLSLKIGETLLIVLQTTEEQKNIP